MISRALLFSISLTLFSRNSLMNLSFPSHSLVFLCTFSSKADIFLHRMCISLRRDCSRAATSFFNIFSLLFSLRELIFVSSLAYLSSIVRPSMVLFCLSIYTLLRSSRSLISDSLPSYRETVSSNWVRFIPYMKFWWLYSSRLFFSVISLIWRWAFSNFSYCWIKLVMLSCPFFRRKFTWCCNFINILLSSLFEPKP